MKSKLFLGAVALFAVLTITSCKTGKMAEPVRTLAQMCADSFPCGDTLIYVQVDVPVEIVKWDTFTVTMVEETMKPGDSIRTYLTVPGRNIVIQKTVMVPAQIDSALRVAHKELEAAYVKAIKDLQECQEKAKQRAVSRKSGGSNWLTWLVAGLGFGLVVLVLFGRFVGKLTKR